tara:strand:+ start:2944 stop:3132 length:189 start_codon:yes stop_codon:yes gene_type:complete
MSELYGDKFELLTERLALANTAIAAKLAHRDSIIEKQASEIDSLKAQIKRLGYQTMFIINEM